MTLDRASVIRVRKEIGDREETDERHQDAHGDLQPEWMRSPHRFVT